MPTFMTCQCFYLYASTHPSGLASRSDNLLISCWCIHFIQLLNPKIPIYSNNMLNREFPSHRSTLSATSGPLKVSRFSLVGTEWLLSKWKWNALFSNHYVALFTCAMFSFFCNYLLFLKKYYIVVKSTFLETGLTFYSF